MFRAFYQACTDPALQLFFRVTVCVERTPLGMYRPTVNIDFMNGVFGHNMSQGRTWLVFAMELQAVLIAEIERALHDASAAQDLSL